MESRRVVLNFATRIPRDEAIQLLQRLVQESDISILDCRMFSDMSLVLEVEGLTAGALSLTSALLQSSFRIATSSQDQIDKLARENSESIIHGTIQVTFATGDGSLVIPVPWVPG